MTNHPFCYLASKNGVFGGVISTRTGSQEIGRFMREFIADGYAVVSCATRDEYLTKVNQLTFPSDVTSEPKQGALL